MRRHGSLSKDDETNEAAWEAARGATAGAAKVSVFADTLFLCESFGCVEGIERAVIWDVMKVLLISRQTFINHRGSRSFAFEIEHDAGTFAACV
jgi:hypothetical protein